MMGFLYMKLTSDKLGKSFWIMLGWDSSRSRERPRFIQITPNLHAPKQTKIVPPPPGNPVYPVVVDDPLTKPKPAPYTAPVPTTEHVHRQESIPCLTSQRLTVTGKLVSPELDEMRRRIEVLSVPNGGDNKELKTRIEVLERLVKNMEFYLQRVFGNS